MSVISVHSEFFSAEQPRLRRGPGLTE
jgi:hypothetical protein